MTVEVYDDLPGGRFEPPIHRFELHNGPPCVTRYEGFRTQIYRMPTWWYIFFVG